MMAWCPPRDGISGVPSGYVPLVWDEALMWLRPVIDGESDITADSVAAEIAAARLQLWGAWSGGRMIAAIVTHLPDSADWPVCTVVMAGGTERRLWLRPYWDLVCRWARAQGRRCMIVCGRRGWQRLLGLSVGGALPDGRPMMYFPLEAAQ